jgi:hypothetical protein
MKYWQRYDSLFKNYSKKDLFEKLKRLCSKLGSPYTKRGVRGRKLKFDPVTYASYIALQKIFGHKYREMELESTLYLGKRADHSTFARNYEKIPQEYIEKLIESLVDREFTFWIADSTAMSSTVRVMRTRQGTRNKELLTDKYHLVIGYDPPSRTTMILGAKATDNHVSDSKAAVEILKNRKSNAYFLGDSAYNTYELHETIKEVGLYPMIKPDKRGIRKAFSDKAKNLKLFSKEIYKEIRGVVETVFGGATNAGLILSFAKKEHTRRLDTLMLALRHNLMANIRLNIINFIALLCDKLDFLLFFILRLKQ